MGNKYPWKATLKKKNKADLPKTIKVGAKYKLNIMKKDLKHFTVLIFFSLILTAGAALTSCELGCDWYVTDADGILTGYEDESTCKEWAAEWDDVWCDCI